MRSRDTGGNDRQGNAAAPLFDEAFYLQRNPDVAKAKIDPFQHYVEHGWSEGRSPHPLFDVGWYLGNYPDVAAAGVDARQHYLSHGWREGRSTHPLFDPIWYIASNPDLDPEEIDPLFHYLDTGWREGRRPNPLFDPIWYYDGLIASGDTPVEPLSHYLSKGQDEGRWPSPLFDPSWYVTVNPDVRMSSVNPLAHYLRYGMAEGRSPSRLIDIIGAFDRAEGMAKANKLEMFLSPRGGVVTALPSTAAGIEDGEARGRYLVQYDSWIENQLASYLDAAIDWHGHVCTFFSPVGLLNADVSEGSRRRIKFIDDSLNFIARVYLVVDHAAGAGLQLKRSEGTWEIFVPKRSSHLPRIADLLLDRSPAIYVHSLFGVNGLSEKLARRRGKLIVDFHGVVPEEAELKGALEEQIAMAAIEAEIVEHADLLVTVSRRMTAHFRRKYRLPPDRFAELPFVLPLPERRVVPVDDRGIHVAYVGGLQAWQQVDRMLESIATATPQAHYSIITPDVEEARRALTSRGDHLSVPLNLRHLPNNHVPEFLTTVHYGFALRTKSVVNDVACPTKLIEYMAYGVVPIMDDIMIGDIVALGLNFVGLDEYLAGNLPPEAVRASMAHANGRVMDQLWRMWRAGMARLVGTMFEAGEPASLYCDESRGLQLML